MTDQKPTGVFMQFPVTDEQAQEMYKAYCAAYARSSLTTRGTATQAALLAIGTPVAGGELEVAAYDNIASGYLSRVEPVTPNINLVRQSDAQAQIAALEAEAARLRGVIVEAVDALTRVTEERSTQYQAKNGRWVSIQADDGERCDIIHSDITTDCEAAILSAHKALKGGAA